MVLELPTPSTVFYVVFESEIQSTFYTISSYYDLKGIIRNDPSCVNFLPYVKTHEVKVML